MKQIVAQLIASQWFQKRIMINGIEGELLLSDGDDLVTREYAVEKLKNNKWFTRNNPDFDFTNEELISEALSENGFKTSDEYFDEEYLETFTDTYTTKGGETVVAFGKYGTDN